jgi:predicted DNA-binding protein (MmcQ/YjbR family)
MFSGELQYSQGATGIAPRPYLASRGLLWIQRIGEETMSDETLKDYLRQSYLRAAMTLTKKRRFELRIGLSE